VPVSERLKSVFGFLAKIIRNQSCALPFGKTDEHIAELNVPGWNSGQFRQSRCHADEQSKPEVRK
jgi:hypothetical protein